MFSEKLFTVPVVFARNFLPCGNVVLIMVHCGRISYLSRLNTLFSLHFCNGDLLFASFLKLLKKL